MKCLSKALVSALFVTLASSAFAQVDVSNAWVRGTAPGQKATGAFMTLHAHETSKLLSAASPIAGVVEIHEMKMEGTTMRMRAVPNLPLPSMKDVELKPGAGGHHIMLMELTRELKVGEKVPLTLTVELPNGKRVKQTVQAEVRPLTAAAPQAGSGAHGHHHH